MACFRLETKTAAAWTAENPRLARGQVGVETDPDTGAFGKAKLADGVRRWNDLAYWDPAASAGGGGTYEAAAETPDDVEDTFTFSGPPVMVFRNGVNETRLGSVVGSTFVFDTPPETGDDVEGLI